VVTRHRDGGDRRTARGRQEPGRSPRTPRRPPAPGPWAALLAILAAACAAPGPPPQPGYVFYPDLPETPRIQYLTTFSSEWDVTGPMGRLEKFVVGERQPGGIIKPYGVAVRAGKIFVCDTVAGSVFVLDLVGKGIESLGERPPGRLRKPINIAVDEDGTRYVTDRALQRVLVYDEENRYVRAIGGPEVWAPTDVVISGEYLYVTDRDNGQVVVVDKASGEEVRRLGEEGIDQAQFMFPTNLAVDREGNIYVTDTGNYRIQKIDARGRQLREFGAVGDALGQFARPKGIAVDAEGRIYAVDAAFANIQIFDAEGRLLLVFGGAGAAPGNMYLPAKVAIDYDHIGLFRDRVAPGYEVEYLIFVTNQYGPNKINVYGFLKQPAGD
jgi:DNA-binding beta-propeller fold protein YncE